MEDIDREPLRPVVLTSSSLVAPTPRLHAPVAPVAQAMAASAEGARHGLATAPPAPQDEGSHAAHETVGRPRRGGAIVLAARAKLSLPRLFRLEQDLTRVAGTTDVALDVLEDGQVVVYVPPRAEALVRQFLILDGQAIEEAA